jgi:subtilisin family serine protease
MSVVSAHHWSRGEGATVAVIDTGVDASHPDLAGRVRQTRNFVDHDQDRFEQDRHGTEVAGVIAAVGNNGQGIVGVAPRVQLLALKACWQSAPGSSAAVCNSFTLAEALGSAIDAHVDVINLSLVGPADPLLAALTRKAVEQGTIVVGAVPANGGMNGFPAGVPGVIAVDMAEQAAPAKGALRAPGRDVLTLAPEGHYDFATGSSLATANVSGIVALMRARQPQMTAASARALLARSMQDIAGQAPAVETINACAALSELLMTGHCPNSSDPSGAATASVASETKSIR